MSDADPLAAIQPGAGDGGAATPPAPEPPAPVEPPAPPVDGTGKDGALTPEEKTEAEDWDKAADEIFPGLRSTNKDKDNEQTQPEKGTQEAPADGKNPTDKKPDEAAGNGNVADKGGEAKKPADGEGDGGTEEDEQTEPTDAFARLDAREQAAQVEALKTDIRTKVFGEVPTRLQDKEGDPISSVEDVMKLLNPATGEAFTREEAEAWLPQAQAKFRESLAELNASVDAIADTQMGLKDQADIINYQYGELLRAMPDLRQSLWEQFEKTTTSQNGIITKAPVNMQKFYEAALEPYAALGRRLEADEAAKTDTDDQAAAVQAASAAKSESDRQTRRQDRSDIYGGGKTDTRTDDQKDWDAAAEAVFGDQLKALK